MESTKLPFLAVAVMLLHASWCAVARHHQDPEPCGDSALLGHKDHRCSSPAVSPQDIGGAPAMMVVTSFEKGGDGGGPSACDGVYYSNEGQIAALSTEWYWGGVRCHKHIRITSVQSGRTVTAEVVDEVDGDNIVATSKAVWDAFGLDTNIGEVSITWLDDQ